jgi:hypothetical protein
VRTIVRLCSVALVRRCRGRASLHGEECRQDEGAEQERPGWWAVVAPIPRITYLIPRGGMQTLAFTTFTDARSCCALASGTRPDGLGIHAV